jgi:hypothetical protein
MHQASRWRLPWGFVAILGASAISFVASARKPPVPPIPLEGPNVEAYLIRQNSSDCTNSNVNANNPSLIGGTAFVVRGDNGNTTVKVAITASPNTTYNFYLKCVRQLGTITTQDEGEGNGLFQFPTNAVGSVYGFDMYPNGAPPGNVFQSVHVKFQ